MNNRYTYIADLPNGKKDVIKGVGFLNILIENIRKVSESECDFLPEDKNNDPDFSFDGTSDNSEFASDILNFKIVNNKSVYFETADEIPSDFLNIKGFNPNNIVVTMLD